MSVADDQNLIDGRVDEFLELDPTVLIDRVITAAAGVRDATMDAAATDDLVLACRALEARLTCDPTSRFDNSSYQWSRRTPPRMPVLSQSATRDWLGTRAGGYASAVNLPVHFARFAAEGDGVWLDCIYSLLPAKPGDGPVLLFGNLYWLGGLLGVIQQEGDVTQKRQLLVDRLVRRRAAPGDYGFADWD